MNDIEIKENAINIIKNLVQLSYSEIFEISPLERELINLHMQNKNVPEPIIGMMFCAIMLGNKSQAIECGNKVWDIKQYSDNEIEMLYVDCLINVGDFDKAQTLISAKMDNLERNIDLYYSTVVKYALYTGNLYVLNNLAQNPQIYVSDVLLFEFAKKYYTGINNKHYIAILKIIKETIGDSICTTEYLIHDNGSIQLCLYTSENNEDNLKKQDIIFEKIKSYYLSMQENPVQDVFIRIENIKLHPSWW